MDPLILMRITFLLAFVIVLGYAALRIWRRRNAPDPSDRSKGFRPRIGFTRLDGMSSLSLLLSNNSDEDVWAEEIEIFLSELVATDQTAEPSCHGIQKIRQMVRADDMLPISLSEAIYKAAGEPQRSYSCVLSAVLRFRIDTDPFEKNMGSYRIGMAGLTASSVHRERKAIRAVRTPNKPPDIPAIAAGLK